MSKNQSKVVRTMRASFLLLLGLVMAPGLTAQEPDFFISSGREMTRADLEASLRLLEEAAVGDQYGNALKERARAEADVLRRRLSEGDFRVGDRIQVQVAGENWSASSPGAVQGLGQVPTPGSVGVATGRGSVGATFTVQTGPAVKLPDIPVISLKGVLRSELQAHLTEEISRYIRQPEVQAESLIRVSVFGSVGNPGFFYPGAEQNVGDVIMLAGGPAADANYERIMVRRGQEMLWEAENLQRAMAEGRTLDQLNFQAGDIIEVPQKNVSNVWFEVGRYALILGSTLLLGIRVF
jgi:protein involved in polysaccharide export with SLBB domain